MPDRVQVQYWDSMLFISFLTRRDMNKVAAVRQLLRLYEEERIEIVISAATFAELRPLADVLPEDRAVRGEKAQAVLIPYDMAQLAIIDAVLDSERIDIRPLTPAIGRSAAAIGYQVHQLMPMDCTHIATAVAASCDVLLTWDGDKKRRRPSHMLRHDRAFGDPPLRIRTPEDVLRGMDAGEQLALRGD